MDQSMYDSDVIKYKKWREGRSIKLEERIHKDHFIFIGSKSS